MESFLPVISTDFWHQQWLCVCVCVCVCVCILWSLDWNCPQVNARLTYFAQVSCITCGADAAELQPLIYACSSVFAWTGWAAFTCRIKLKQKLSWNINILSHYTFAYEYIYTLSCLMEWISSIQMQKEMNVKGSLEESEGWAIYIFIYRFVYVLRKVNHKQFHHLL